MQRSSVRTLLINEDRDQYLQLARLLQAVPEAIYDLTWCADYRYALEGMLSAIHDVIILDYEDAPAVCEELLRAAAAHGCTTPIICLSAQDDPHLDRIAIKSGASDYLVKQGLSSVILERTIRYAIDRKRAETELARLAHYDALTGVPNRLLFNDRLDRALQRAERGDLPLALLYVDLDGFKAVNDKHGHDVGDELVQGIAQRLSQCVRRTDSVARIGGDEFTVLLERVSSTNDIVSIAQKIIDVVTEPFYINGQTLQVGSSIGIAVYPEAGTDAQSLLKHADMAMYEAKAVDGSNYRFFTHSLNEEVDDLQRLQIEMRSAISDDELCLHFQPRISLRTGKVVSLESLLRWQHPERGLLTPGEFLPVAEQIDLLPTLGYWVLSRLCKHLVQLDELGSAPLKVSVNVASEQLLDPDFVDNVQQILEQHKLGGDRLEFELAEPQLVANPEHLEKPLQALSELGISFTLDDFGRGLSSLSNLQQLPFSTVKIDASHIAKLPAENDVSAEGSDAESIVIAMLSLARQLELKVVAEGVETQSQREFLEANQCSQMQGFLYSKPLPFDEVVKLLNDGGATSRRSYLTVVDK